MLSSIIDSKGVSLHTEHFYILKMSKCTKVGHCPTLSLAPGSQKQLNDVMLSIPPPAVAQSIVARETSD